MEREIQELRRQCAEKSRELQEYERRTGVDLHKQKEPGLSNAQLLATDRLTALHQGAAGSLIDLKNSGSKANWSDLPVLGNIQLSQERASALFKDYFTYYHPFLPILDPDKPWQHYADISPLLFWTIISVACRRYADDPTLLTGISAPVTQLVWSTLAQVPHNYHVVKAFCLLCTWPLPTKSTSTDPTFMYSGLMMSIALQVGLHRPSHVQDFSRIRVELRDEDVRDRLTTWAACNMVSQAVSTGYGQPPKSIYDYTLTSIARPCADDTLLSPDLYWRLQIERFSNRVSQNFYVNRTDSLGVSSDQERKTWMGVLAEEYHDLERDVRQLDNPISTLHLLAAGLHLRLVAFFDSPTFPGYRDDLIELYHATSSFLTHALELNAPASTSGSLSGGVLSPGQINSPYVTFTGIPNHPTLIHVGFYILQLLLAGGFTLMKLLNSFFAHYIDAEAARHLFNATVRAIRSISLANNDLPARLAEVLAQLWRSSGAGQNKYSVTGHEKPAADDSLQLKVRCRMSISLLFDSVWRWREENQFRGGADNSAIALASLDQAAENPTDPEAETSDRPVQTASVNNSHFDGAMDVPGAALDSTLPSTAMGADLGGGMGDLGYEVFDPLTWMLDGELGMFPDDTTAQMFGGSGLG